MDVVGPLIGLFVGFIVLAAFLGTLAWLLQFAGRLVGKAWQRHKAQNPWRPAPKQGAAEAPPPGDDREPSAAWLWLRDRLATLFSRAVDTAKGFRNPFVFYNQFGFWPVVRRPLNGKPGNFIMYAPYSGPRRVRFATSWKAPVLTGVVLALLWWAFYAEPYRPGPNDPPFILSLAEVALFLGLPSVPFWWTIGRRNWFFRIRFIDGAMIWRGPDLRKRRIPADAPRFEGMIHRLAEREAQKQADWQRANPGKAPPKRFFQTSSEVVAMVSNRPWLTVAEFVNDLGQERAGRLIRALNRVRAAAVLERRTGKQEQEQADSRQQDEPL